MGIQRLRKAACALGVAAGLAGPAAAAPWLEVGDAGELLGTAQTVSGVGPLTSISGAIAVDRDRDLYRIYIPAGGGFSAATASAGGDPQLFLFTAAGLGIMSDDDSGPGLESALPLGHPLISTLPAGYYYLAISEFDDDPTSVGGEIFGEGSLQGPSGPGGASPLSGWFADGAADTWTYTITLTGAQFAAAVPSPAVPALLGIGLLGLAASRRRVR